VERVLPDNGTEIGRHDFGSTRPAGVRHTKTRSERPLINGRVKRLQRTIVEECWRPAFALYLQVRLDGLRRDLARCRHDCNFNREHYGGITDGRRPTDLVYGACEMEPR
jgi:hypothetical protein